MQTRRWGDRVRGLALVFAFWGAPGLGQPGLGQPGLSQPSAGQPSVGQPSVGQPGAQGLLDDGVGAYHTGKYRDLFAEHGHSAAESRAKIDQAYAQLFHGDAQTESVYFEKGSNENGPLGYVTDWANKDVRTEGMSYGMMIAVQMGKKHEFDALWNWATTYMLITDPKNPSRGYFAWSMNTDGTPRSDSPAPDGEEYLVMALYFADHRWGSGGNASGGSGGGIYNYRAEADRLLHLMRHRPKEVGMRGKRARSS